MKLAEKHSSLAGFTALLACKMTEITSNSIGSKPVSRKTALNNLSFCLEKLTENTNAEQFHAHKSYLVAAVANALVFLHKEGVTA